MSAKDDKTPVSAFGRAVGMVIGFLLCAIVVLGLVAAIVLMVRYIAGLF